MKLIEGDCLEEMKNLPDSSVDLILCDPPYFKVKSAAWDNQWADSKKFIAWLDTVANEWYRVLRPNGSLYCFASPQMQAHVEVMLSGKFNILNSIAWAKPSSLHLRHCVEKLRCFAPQTERIIFCEHYGADNIAKGEAGYAAKCDELRGFIFEPLRAYFIEEKKNCGISSSEIQAGMKRLTGKKYVFDRHTFNRSQWNLPTEAQYNAAREVFKEHCRHDCLRKEYEALRRPFKINRRTEFTDVWKFKVVQPYPGKHPCEKPLKLLDHIIRSSTRPGAVVLDSFCGNGNTGIACSRAGREFIGIELDKEYFNMATKRINASVNKPVQGELFPGRE